MYSQTRKLKINWILIDSILVHSISKNVIPEIWFNCKYSNGRNVESVDEPLGSGGDFRRRRWCRGWVQTAEMSVDDGIIGKYLTCRHLAAGNRTEQTIQWRRMVRLEESLVVYTEEKVLFKFKSESKSRRFLTLSNVPCTAKNHAVNIAHAKNIPNGLSACIMACRFWMPRGVPVETTRPH
jgi:hypothetical protein